MPFETFTRQRRADQQPYVTLQKKGSISLNRAAFEALDDPEAVELLYDRGAHLVALRQVDDSVAHSFKVRAPAGNRGTWLIAGGAFASYYEIDISESVRRPARKEGDLLIVDLNDPGVDSRGEPVKPGRKVGPLRRSKSRSSLMRRGGGGGGSLSRTSQTALRRSRTRG